MGADLYIKSILEPLKEKYDPIFKAACAARDAGTGSQEAVDAAYDAMFQDECYFRDSYNATSVLAKIGLSWWQDVIPLCDDEEYIRGEQLAKFLWMIESHEVDVTEITRESLEQDHAKVEDSGEGSVEGWREYFVEKRKRLIEFIKRAQKAGDGIYASL